MAKKKKQHPKRKATRKPGQSTPSALLKSLFDVEVLTSRGRWQEARERLEALHQRYPKRPEPLEELVNLCYDTQDMPGYLVYCRRLFKLTPNNPDLIRGLAGAYMVNGYPALALRQFRDFLARYPNHEEAGPAREMLEILERNMEELLANLSEGANLSPEGRLELAVQHDEVRSLLETGQFGEARRAGKRLLDQYPNFVPALNNLSQVDFIEGQVDQAIATTRRVLELEPDNFQALGNLTRYLYLNSQEEEARQCAERLKAVESDNSDIWLKKMEAFSYLGDDQGVLDAFHRAEERGELVQIPASALAYHLAGVALLNLGREQQARRSWEQALKLDPNFNLAHENLGDLAKPVEERHGAWPFGMRHWLPATAVSDLVPYLQPAARRGNEAGVEKAARRYLQDHPLVVERIPLLLKQGDPGGRDFAINLIAMAPITAMVELPELLDALRDFALGQRGPDQMRFRAAQIASEAGVIPAGLTRMWMRGEWQEILLMGFEIHDEPTREHPPQVMEWVMAATEALQRGNATEAERLFKRALEVAPNEPDILNNLGAAYASQGRYDEAEALLHKIYREHPDYFFGIVGMANLHTLQGDTEQAKALLQPLLSRKRLHFSEFATLCKAHIQLYLAEGRPESAQSWLDMWANIDPDNPDIRYWRRQIRQGDKAAKLGRKSGWREWASFWT